VSPFLRRVKTASGATAVRVVVKESGVRRIVEHLGSAHDEAELAALMRLGHRQASGGPAGPGPGAGAFLWLRAPMEHDHGTGFVTPLMGQPDAFTGRPVTP